jgi:glycosyltransferase involved in cell wall biosynthesis
MTALSRESATAMQSTSTHRVALVGYHIAFLIPDLNGGGVQRVVMILARAFAARGAKVELVVCRAAGQLAAQVPTGVDVVELRPGNPLVAQLAALRVDPGGALGLARLVLSRDRPSRNLSHLCSLAEYLRRSRPHSLFAAAPYLNIAAVLARRLAAVPTRIIVSERTQFSSGKPSKRRREARRLARPLGRAYRQADAIVAVSKGVADDLARTVGLPREAIVTLHNPTITPDFAQKAAEPVDHPWLVNPGPPTILAVGRFGTQKDYPTLVRAFALARRERPLRLMIIGDASDQADGHGRRAEVVALAGELGLGEDLQMPGYLTNPLPYMKRAGILVLSSRYEGLPNVLVEALACGTPVISTDCPSGPREILEDGAYGALIPVGDPNALAAAICATLDNPPNADRLKARAAEFDYDRAIAGYEKILLGPAVESASVRPSDQPSASRTRRQ